MSRLKIQLEGAQVLDADGPKVRSLAIEDDMITTGAPARSVDLSGHMILPGIVDIHGDGFERHLAPRRGAMKDIDQGLLAAEAELAANGITTAVLAQFYSWEGGMRGPEFAERVFGGIAQIRPQVMTDLHLQLRFEIMMLADYQAVQDMAARHDIRYLVLNDHLPHADLAKGKRPAGLTGKALRIGRNPEKHLAYMQELHAQRHRVPEALTRLCTALRQRDVLIGSHDDHSAGDWQTAHARGVGVSEFPETLAAAEAARCSGGAVIMGAPNLVRGGSHKGNVSAVELVSMGLGDALASDYHYPSLRRAAFLLVDSGICDLATAWGLVSAGPARVLGLRDRGSLAPGKRADMVVIETETRRVMATICAGRVSYMNGEVAARFIKAEN